MSSSIEELVEVYVAWLRQLQNGSVSPAPRLDQDALAPIGREIERCLARLSRREKELVQLIDLVHAAYKGEQLDDVLERIFDGFRGIIPFDRMGCAFLTDDNSHVLAYWEKSALGSNGIKAGYAQPLTASSLTALLSSGQPRILNDLEAYLRRKPESNSTRRIVAEGGRSSLTCPLIVDGRPLGFLFFTSGRPNAYHPSHQEIFRQIASQVAIVIDKTRLHERLVMHNRTLTDHNQQLEIVATTDALTGVLNRRALDSRLEQRWFEYQETWRPYGLIMTDIDHFKQINDTVGHRAGDTVLKEFAGRLVAQMRNVDIIGRYGGEEFVMVVDDVSEPQLMDLAERLRRAIAQQAFDVGDGQSVTASFGAACVRETLASGCVLLELADHALYQAKALGRNCCVLAAEQTAGAVAPAPRLAAD